MGRFDGDPLGPDILSTFAINTPWRKNVLVLKDISSSQIIPVFLSRIFRRQTVPLNEHLA